MASLRAYHGPLVLPERTQFQNVGMEYVAHDRQWLAGTARNRRNRHLRHAGMGRHVACSLHLPELRGASSGRFLLVGAARHAPGLRAASHRRIPQRLLGGKGRQGRRTENPLQKTLRRLHFQEQDSLAHRPGQRFRLSGALRHQRLGAGLPAGDEYHGCLAEQPGLLTAQLRGRPRNDHLRMDLGQILQGTLRPGQRDLHGVGANRHSGLLESRSHCPVAG